MDTPTDGHIIDPTREERAVEDIARAEAAVVIAQGDYDNARRQLRLAEIELARAESLRNTARSYHRELRSPGRLRSAITPS
jgi:hypothetical protein